ncbi:hypothetical protein RRG08_020860 [Elysia crispata]|uniref:Uncharacterized protein n=1 Tax=Elysia crispata TaxID=231223 RepID=A0AAE0XVU3_9GAST|nr:hypothetical protein RRG08_020860 [Elysia crispata]
MVPPAPPALDTEKEGGEGGGGGGGDRATQDARSRPGVSHTVYRTRTYSQAADNTSGSCYLGMGSSTPRLFKLGPSLFCCYVVVVVFLEV